MTGKNERKFAVNRSIKNCILCNYDIWKFDDDLGLFPGLHWGGEDGLFTNWSATPRPVRCSQRSVHSLPLWLADLKWKLLKPKFALTNIKSTKILLLCNSDILWNFPPWWCWCIVTDLSRTWQSQDKLQPAPSWQRHSGDVGEANLRCQFLWSQAGEVAYYEWEQMGLLTPRSQRNSNDWQ